MQFIREIGKKFSVFLLLAVFIFLMIPGTAHASQSPTTLTNGGLEYPEFVKNIGDNWFTEYAWTPGVAGEFGWQTTASNNKFEFGGYWNINGWGIEFIPQGGQFIELNASEQAAVYQDLSTIPGTVIYWSLYQGGVWYWNSTNIDNTMAVRICAPGELTDENMISLGVTAFDQEWTNRTIYEISSKTPVSSTPATYSGKEANKKKLYTEPKRWTKYEGVYVVPEGQTTTRFAFASLSTIAMQGNLLDGVEFRVATQDDANNLDSLPPVIGTTNGNPSSDVSGAQTISFNVADNTSGIVSGIASVTVSGSVTGFKTVSQTDTTYQFLATQNETYTITATDHAGNSANAPVEVTHILPADTTAPALSAGAVNRTSDAQATVTFTSSEVGGYFFEVLKDGESSALSTGGAGIPCTTGVTSFDVVALGADSKKINIKVKDAADNVSDLLTINIPAYVDATPTVTGVSVSPTTASVAKGATQQFSATVAGTNSPGQAVTWEVEGANNVSTSISGTGLLSVGSEEDAATLTVKATSTVDLSKNGVATVTIAESDPDPEPVPAPSPAAEPEQKTDAEKEAERISKAKQEWAVSDSNPKNYLTTVKSDDGAIVSSGVPTKNQSIDYFNLIVKDETQEAERVFAKTSADNQIVVTFSKASYGEEFRKLFETTAALQNGTLSKVIQVTAQERTKKDYKLIRNINITEESIRYSAQLSDELLAAAKAGKKILVIGYNHAGEIEVLSDLDETLGIVTFETKNPTGIFAFVIIE